MEWQYYRKLLRNKPELMTSSMGRFLDGISSLLNICHHNTYEGEATMKLEAEAMKCSENIIETYSFFFETDPIQSSGPEEDTAKSKKGLQILWKPMIHEIQDEIRRGINKSAIAYKVHLTLAKMVRRIAENQGIHKIAFSGGVIQNALLIDLLIRELKNDFTLYFHKQLSPNDECISFGQLAFADIQYRKSLRKQSVKKPSTLNHQLSTINHQPSTINYQPSTINHQP
jgi:hydrogenase maturation protein HypF